MWKVKIFKKCWSEYWKQWLMTFPFVLPLFNSFPICSVEWVNSCEWWIGNKFWWLVLRFFPMVEIFISGSCISHDESTKWTCKAVFLACMVSCYRPGTFALCTSWMGKVLWIQWIWPPSGVWYPGHMDWIHCHGECVSDMWSIPGSNLNKETGRKLWY